MDSKLNIEINICGKRMQINVACINNEAKNEISSTLSQRNIDIKDIIKAYILKTQEYAELKEKLENLTQKIEMEIN